MAEAAVEDYRSSLSDLNFNSKPHINMLTMLAEDNIKYASNIVDTIVEHINAVPSHMKLPGLYLVDSIIKNIGGLYVPLFCSHLISLFTSVFEKVDENTRSQLYKLRLTWKDLLPNTVLLHLDTQVCCIDPAWPILAVQPPKTIHVNPKFLGGPPTPEIQEKNNHTLDNTYSSVREVNDIKMKQIEVIKELEEKKEQLRNLEIKKQEKQKTVNILPHVNSLSVRDPRLKKNFDVCQANSMIGRDVTLTNTGNLQSVVVVPTIKTLSSINNKYEDKSSNGSEVPDKKSHESHNHNENSSSVSLKKQRLSIDSDSPIKSGKKCYKDSNKSKVSEKSKNNQNKEKKHLNKNSSNLDDPSPKSTNKKRSLSSSADESSPEREIRRALKQLSPKSKLMRKRENLENEGNPVTSSTKELVNHMNKMTGSKPGRKEPIQYEKKCGKELLLKYKNCNLEDEPKKKKERNIKNQSSIQSTLLFGNEDKDYRSLGLHEVEAENENLKKSDYFQTVLKKDSYPPMQNVNFKHHNASERAYKDKYSSYMDTIMHNPYTVMRQAEEKYNAGTISKMDYQDLCQNIQRMMNNEEYFYPRNTKSQYIADRAPRMESSDSTNLRKEAFNVIQDGFLGKNLNASLPAVKSFKLDNEIRNIYFVDERAFTMLSDNEPRELFFDGPPRNVYVEGLLHPLKLGFNGHSAEFEIAGKIHVMKFGIPGREVYINNVPYEASFGGPPLFALLKDGKMHRIEIDGPPPRVVTSPEPSYDLFHKFHVVNKPHQDTTRIPHRDTTRIPHQDTTRLPHQDTNRIPNQDTIRIPHQDSFEAERTDVLCDVDMRFKTKNAKLNTVCNPLPDTVKDVDWRQSAETDVQQSVFNLPKHSFETFKRSEERFDTSGQLDLNNRQNLADWDKNSMQSSEIKPTPALQPPPVGPFLTQQSYNSISKPLLPQPIDVALSNLNDIGKSLSQFSSLTSNPVMQNAGQSLQTGYISSNHVPLHQAPVQLHIRPPPQPWQPLPPPPPFPGSVPSSNLLNSLPVSVQSVVPACLPAPTNTSTNSSVPLLSVQHTPVTSTDSTPKMDVELFLEKLIAAGIIGKKKEEPEAVVTSDLNSTEKSSEEKNEPEEEIIPTIELVPKALREYHPEVINLLYKGSQCATCGMRFKEIQSEHYSRHLDWHFRTNRREKDGAKKPFSRRLFYEIKDWVQFQEFEDFEERAPSYFELQASGEQSKEEENSNVQSVPSVRCETEVCAVCGEQFQLFWVEEEEEWHLRHAVRHSEQVYHPACYEDFCKVSEKSEPSADEQTEEAVIKQEPVEQMEEDNSTLEVPAEMELSEEDSKEKESVPSNNDPVPVVKIKEEPMDEDEQIDVKKQDNCVSTELKSENEESKEPASVPSNESTTEKKEQTVEPLETSQTETKPTSLIEEKTEEEVIEFRPPTPDPRFQSLPPVLKGTELSALCCIM